MSGRTPSRPEAATIHRDLLARGGRLRLPVRGGSMLPLIRRGDVLQVRARGHYRIGDILLVDQQGLLVAHRLVGRERRDGRELLLLRGDAETRGDAPVAARDVLGRVESIERRGRVIPANGRRAAVGRVLAGLSVGGRPMMATAAAPVRRLKRRCLAGFGA